MSNQYPKEVAEIASKLNEAGFEAYLVGGCVRDMLLDREPKDWDIATNAKPNEVQKKTHTQRRRICQQAPHQKHKAWEGEENTEEFFH